MFGGNFRQRGHRDGGLNAPAPGNMDRRHDRQQRQHPRRFCQLSADISGPGTLNFNFSGSLTGNNTYSGGSTLNSSQVFGTTSGIQGNWTMTNGQILFQQNVAGSTSANISGTGIVSVFWTGQVTLLSSNSYSGTTNVSGGHLGIGNNSALGTSSLQTFGFGEKLARKEAAARSPIRWISRAVWSSPGRTI